ncbi:MAG: HDOD domain-containing protein [bacterium]|nr:HDOD domain-containing protein [bacterium]
MSAVTMTPEKISRNNLQAMLDSIEDLPSIPETLMKILDVLDDPDSGASDLAEVVRLDAPLMSKILRLANSPYYSPRGGISDINRCVSVLGYRTVRQVAICISVASTVISAVQHKNGTLDYRELWRHSVVTGAISKYLATMSGYPDPEEIFTAGLLHDIGKYIFELHSPDKYKTVLTSSHEESQSLTSVEFEAFGVDHATLGGAFGKSWRFPYLIVACFEKHHEPVLGNAVSQIEKAIALVALGDYLANTMAPPRVQLGFNPSLVDAKQLHANAGLEVDDVKNNLEKIKEAVELASGYIDL